MIESSLFGAQGFSCIDEVGSGVNVQCVAACAVLLLSSHGGVSRSLVFSCWCCGRLAAAQKKMNNVLKKMGMRGQLCLIVFLIAILVLLLVLIFS